MTKKSIGFGEAALLLFKFKRNIVDVGLRDVFVKKAVLNMQPEQFEAATKDMFSRHDDAPLAYKMDLADLHFDDAAWLKMTKPEEDEMLQHNAFMRLAIMDEIATKNLQDELDLLWNTAENCVNDAELDAKQSENAFNLVSEFGKDMNDICVSEPWIIKSIWRLAFGNSDLFQAAQIYFQSAIHDSEHTAQDQLKILLNNNAPKV